MGFPVTVNGNTYNESDFTGYGYKTALPDMISDTASVAGDAATSASDALGYASAASSSASAASSSAAAAAASYDSFDDRYLGAKSSDPTTDNDGNALLTGALYYKTTATAGMRIYNGSAWEAVGIPISGGLTTSDIGVTVQGYDATTLKSAAIGVSVQAYDADTAKTDTAQNWTAQQTFKELKDTVYTITDGAAFEIDPANGSMQTITLGASRTPAATNFEAGQMVLLGIDDGTAYSITWTTVSPTWVKAGGTASAPTLATSGYTWVLLWRVGAVIYATEVGKP